MADTIFRAHAIQGSLTGTIGKLRDVIDLIRQGELAPTLIQERPEDQADAALDNLEHGWVVGRVALVGPSG